MQGFTHTTGNRMLASGQIIGVQDVSSNRMKVVDPNEVRILPSSKPRRLDGRKIGKCKPRKGEPGYPGYRTKGHKY